MVAAVLLTLIQPRPPAVDCIDVRTPGCLWDE